MIGRSPSPPLLLPNPAPSPLRRSTSRVPKVHRSIPFHILHRDMYLPYQSSHILQTDSDQSPVLGRRNKHTPLCRDRRWVLVLVLVLTLDHSKSGSGHASGSPADLYLTLPTLSTVLSHPCIGSGGSSADARVVLGTGAFWSTSSGPGPSGGQPRAAGSDVDEGRKGSCA